MEQLTKLIVEQKNLAEELGRKLATIKKEAKIRKEEKLLDQRSQEVESLWQSFCTRHSEIMELDKERESSYVKSNFFEQVEELWNKARSQIFEIQEAIIETQEKKQREIKLIEQGRRIEILKADIECATMATEGYAQYLEDIKKQFTVIVDNDVELCRTPMESRESTYFRQNWFQTTRQKYREVTVFLDKKLREQNQVGTTTVATSGATNSSSNLILPKLKIPIFTGKYEEWPTFQDIFTKVIDMNNNVSKVEKMQYLKTYVKGEAKDAIQHYEITENNYDSAWKELKQRYDNKRRIVNRLINKILQIPVMQNESQVQLKNMYNTIKECMEALKMQDMKTVAWDPIIVCVVANKWDSRTNELFETSIEDNFKIQSLESVLKFLMRRFQSMEAAESKTKDDKGTTRTPIHTNGQYKTKCKYCNSSHSLYACVEFKALSNNERFQFVKENKLCFNCLNHEFGKKCFSNSKCRVCEKNHHTLIHTDAKVFVKSNNQSKNAQNVNDKSKPQERSVKVASNVAIFDETALLATALIKVKNASNGYEYLRALIDPGSQASFVTEETAVLLGLPREKIFAEITGVGDTRPKVSTQKIKVACKGRTATSYNMNCELYVLALK